MITQPAVSAVLLDTSPAVVVDVCGFAPHTYLSA